MTKIPGNNFLHNHPALENKAGLDSDHVIVDTNDWLEVLQILNAHPELINPKPTKPYSDEIRNF